MSKYLRYENEKRKLLSRMKSGQITPEEYENLIKKLAKKLKV